VAAAERHVFHADLIHVPVDQPGRAQVAGAAWPNRRQSGQTFVRQLNRFFGGGHGHAQLFVGRGRDGGGNGTGDFRRRCGCRGGGERRDGRERR